MATIPTPTRLVPDPARVARWRAVVPPGRRRVGIAWQGNPAAFDDRGRSMPLAAFAPLAAVPGVVLVALQRGPGAEQAVGVPWVHGLGDGFDAGQDAFLDTAAVMASLDAVVTSDTAVAHLAGSLGRPTRVALRRHAEWRWLTDRADSPWYPGLRLVRQTVDGAWGPVFARVAADLAGTG